MTEKHTVKFIECCGHIFPVLFKKEYDILDEVYRDEYTDNAENFGHLQDKKFIMTLEPLKEQKNEKRI